MERLEATLRYLQGRVSALEPWAAKLGEVSSAVEAFAGLGLHDELCAKARAAGEAAHVWIETVQAFDRGVTAAREGKEVPGLEDVARLALARTSEFCAAYGAFERALREKRVTHPGLF